MSDMPPISQAHAWRRVRRILQVFAVLGAFWALSACISMMQETEQAAVPVQQIYLQLPPVEEEPPAPPVVKKPQPQRVLMKGTKAAPMRANYP